MTRPLAGAFLSGKPIIIRLADSAVSEGLPDGDIELYSATLVDGWLRADFRHNDGRITRYLLPPGSVKYVHQLQTPAETGADAPEPEQV